METSTLAGQPAKQPDLEVCRQRQAVKPAAVVGEPDERAPVVRRGCGCANESAQFHRAQRAACPRALAVLAFQVRPVASECTVACHDWDHPINPIDLVVFPLTVAYRPTLRRSG